MEHCLRFFSKSYLSSECSFEDVVSNSAATWKATLILSGLLMSIFLRFAGNEEVFVNICYDEVKQG